MDARFLHALRTSKGLSNYILWRKFEKGIKPRRMYAERKRIERRIKQMADEAWGVNRETYDTIIYIKACIEILTQIDY